MGDEFDDIFTLAITITEAQKRGLIQLYVPSSPNEEINSQYGNIPYYKFLKFEQERINKSSMREAVIVKGGFLGPTALSLWVNPV